MRYSHLNLTGLLFSTLRVLGLYLTCTGSPAPAAQENVWLGTSSNAWASASNWSLGHIPLASENVRIDTGTVVAESEIKFATLTLNDGSLRVSGNLNGTHVVVAQTATLAFTSNTTIYLAGTISNHGVVVWENGNIDGGNRATWYACGIFNEADGTFEILRDGVFGDGAVCNNAGLLRKHEGLEVTSFARTISNTGTISLESGTLFAEYGINQSAGAIRLAGGSLRADDYTGIALSGGEITGSGLITGGVGIQQGTLRPGGDTNSHLKIDGSLTLSSNTTTEISLPSSASPTAPIVSVTGTLTIAGKLVFRFTDGVTPNYSSRYSLFDAGGRFGGFNNNDLPTRSAGTYLLDVDYSGTAADLVISAPPYFNWRHQQFAESTDATIIGDDADPDGDGIPNLLEYAFGLNPVQPSHSGLPVISIESDPIDSTKHLTLTFRTPADAIDAYFTPQTSADLLTWSSDWWETDLVSDTTTDGIRTRVIRDTTPVESRTRSFMRLKVAFSP